jgi:hypothetical protein
MTEISPKQALYQEMLRLAFMYTRAKAGIPRWRRVKDRSIHEEMELIHNLTVSIFEPGFVAHDIHFLNWQARYYVEKCKAICPLYSQQIELIRQLFSLVPSDLREQLKWEGPRE